MNRPSSPKALYGSATPPQRKRPYQARTKNGCITCRIRRVRCDQQKPLCIRCTSTARKCDGYGETTGKDSVQNSASSSTAPVQSEQGVVSITRHPRVPLPKHSDKELRCYHFFLDITAPELASVFDVEFWLADIPRTCHSDAVIWHAVVGLGAAHEKYVVGQGAAEGGAETEFALKQLSVAVGTLVRSMSSRPRRDEKWRALVVSILFTYLCSFLGLHSQSDVHFAAAKSLFKELEEGHQARLFGPEAMVQVVGATTALAPTQLLATSVSRKSLLSVIAQLEIQSQALHNCDPNEAPEFLGDNETYTAWRYYSPPARTPSMRLCQHARCVPSRATPENLARAGRCFESLLNALIALSQQNAPAKVTFDAQADRSVLDSLILRQKPYTRAFHELDIGLSMFLADTTSECACFGTLNTSTLSLSSNLLPVDSASSVQYQKKAIEALQLFREICYEILYQNSQRNIPCGDSIPIANPEAVFESRLDNMLNIAGSVLRADRVGQRLRVSEFTPALSPMIPLLVIAHNGSTLALRQRAVALLRQFPRRNGLWDSLLVAALLDAFLKREIALERGARIGDKRVQFDRQGQLKGNKNNKKSETCEDEVISERPRVRWAVVKFTGTHSASVVFQTLTEWVKKEPGYEIGIVW